MDLIINLQADDELRSPKMGCVKRVNPSIFRFEINLSPSGTRVVFEFCLDLLGEVGKQHNAAIARSGVLLESSDVEIFSVGELVRWLSKPPKPLATQTHEPKMKVAL